MNRCVLLVFMSACSGAQVVTVVLGVSMGSSPYQTIVTTFCMLLSGMESLVTILVDSACLTIHTVLAVRKQEVLLR